jgi:N-acetylglucosamine-6-sulfatase
MPARARIAAALAPVVAVCLLAGAPAAPKSEGTEEERPNVVVVMTDDQTVESLRVMPRLDRFVRAKGVEFASSFASNPLCCPSRATFLTGQYPHNHGVLRNVAPNGGYAQLDGRNTLPVWMQRAGYATVHIGKYLNGYGREDPTEVPPGWDEWRGSVDPTTYSMYGFTLNENGALTTYGDPDVVDPAAYQTDVYRQKAVDVIERRAPDQRPFFLSVAPLAPHGESDLGVDDPPDGEPGPRAAPRHEGAFAAEPLPLPPSYNEADVSDKPAEIQALTPIGPNAGEDIAKRYRNRLETLLAVDDMVGALITALRRAGELDETLFVFTSDNGFLHGEHRLRQGKQQAYEESIRVPLLMRGPGLPEGATRTQPVANVDLAATILDYAGAEAERTIDGRSLRRIAAEPSLEPGRAILIENWCGVREECFDPEVPRYRAVRTHRYLYAERPTGEAELYDLASDPYQLESKHADPAYAGVRLALSRLLRDLATCEGAGCRAEPRLRLKLDYERRRQDDERCTASGVMLTLGGRDEDEAVALDAFADGDPSGTDPAPPLRRYVATRELRRARPTELRANVTVLDGRVTSLDAKVPPRC